MIKFIAEITGQVFIASDETRYASVDKVFHVAPKHADEARALFVEIPESAEVIEEAESDEPKKGKHKA